MADITCIRAKRLDENGSNSAHRFTTQAMAEASQTSKARSDTFMVVPRHANFRCNERAERLAWLAIISKGQPRDHANMCKGKSSGSDDIPASRLNPGWKIR